MFQIWTERQIPKIVKPMLDGVAELRGAASDTPNAPLADLSGAEAIIAGATTIYDKSFLSEIPTLRVISRTGIGIDNIIVQDATDLGVAVCNTPEGPTISTAEHTITLMMAVAKHVKPMAAMYREGATRDYVSIYQGIELHGLQLGLIGLGRIGSRVAAIAKAIGMSVWAYDPFIDPEKASELGIVSAQSFEEVLKTSDVISLHAPLTPETHKLMNTERFAMMKKGAIFVNAARGGLVDEAALLETLERGHLQGAGLDVFDPEPARPGHPLLGRMDVVATPHVAGVTVAGRERMWRMALTNVLQVLRGECPEHIINPEVLTG